MLIKEYRIPMPMSVEEYRIAQLYMIQVSSSFICIKDNPILCTLLVFMRSNANAVERKKKEWKRSLLLCCSHGFGS